MARWDSRSTNSSTVGYRRCLLTKGSTAGRPSWAMRYGQGVRPSLVVCFSNTCARLAVLNIAFREVRNISGVSNTCAFFTVLNHPLWQAVEEQWRLSHLCRGGSDECPARESEGAAFGSRNAARNTMQGCGTAKPAGPWEPLQIGE